MSLLFVIVLLVSFGLWLAAAIPGSRVPEWSARLGFLIAALIWALPRLGS
jgi:hypothetical protein